jgi:hypothetical protein
MEKPLGAMLNATGGTHPLAAVTPPGESPVTVPERAWAMIDRIVANVNPILGRSASAVRSLATARAALVLGTLTLLLFAVAPPLAVFAHASSFSNLFLGLVLGVPFGIVGTLLAYRLPRNPVGWLLLASAFGGALASDAGFYALLRYRHGYGGLPLGPLAVFLAPVWIPLIVLLPLPLALFPAGRMPSRRWRLTLWGYVGWATAWVGVLTAVQVDALVVRPIRVDGTGEALVFANGPKAGVWHTVYFLSNVLLVPYVAFAVAWVWMQVCAYRRADGDERQQLKWLMGGGVVLVVGFVLSIALNGQRGFWGVVSDIATAGLPVLPFCIGVGILKYRLYEIDRLISRTISYLVVTGVLVGVFAGIVLLATRVLPFSSPVGVAASTLAAAALFNPLRRRVQGLVDRRFNRTRYDAEAVLAAFGDRLRGAVDLESVQTGLLAAVSQTTAPVHASIWLRNDPETVNR